MRILIVKTSALGDIIHTFPVLDYLKDRFPDAKIDWVVEKAGAPLLEAHPHIDRVHTADTKRWRFSPFCTRHAWRTLRGDLQTHTYDVVFDLQGNTKSALFTFWAHSKNKVGFDRASVPEWTNLLVTNTRFNPPTGRNIRQDYLHIVASYFEDPDAQILQTSIALNITDQEKNRVDTLLPAGKQTLLVCPGSAWPNKRLSPDALQALLHSINEASSPFFLFASGNEEELSFAQELAEQFPDSAIADRLPLPTLQHVMSRVDRIIAVDSLPLHLAGTTDTPSFSIFGPSLAAKYRPLGPQNTSVQGPCPYGRTFEKRCPILRTCPTGACIHDLPVDTMDQQFPLKVFLAKW